MPYSDGFKVRMVQRMAGPEGISATSLSREVGVPQQTLSRWLRKAGEYTAMTDDSNPVDDREKRPQDWSPEEKLQVVVEAAALSDEELGAFLRAKGLRTCHLVEWRKKLLGALRPDDHPRARGYSKESKRIRALEKEIQRKDKALAEVTALLALKKKLEEVWGDGDDDTQRRSGD